MKLFKKLQEIDFFSGVFFNFVFAFLVVVAVLFAGDNLLNGVSVSPETIANNARIARWAGLFWIFIGLVRGTYSTPGEARLHAGLNKEIWIAILMMRFYPDSYWLEEATTDMSEFVENNTINLADCGVDPNVIIDNNIYPIPMATRTDTPLALPLHTFDSENTIVRNIEKIELSYDKMASVTLQHKEALRNKVSQYAAHNYAPASNTANTPVYGTTGTTDGAGNKLFTIDDLVKQQLFFDNADINEENRYALLSTKHIADLMAQDKTLYKQFIDWQRGKPLDLCGFKIRKYTKNAKYNRSTLVKTAFQAAPAGTDAVGVSQFWSKGEVMKADGTYDMFLREKDPEQRGDIIGFQKRFTGLQIRGKGVSSTVTQDV